MRKRIWVTSIIVLAVCLVLLLKVKQPNKADVPEPSEPITNHTSQPEQLKAAENHQVSTNSNTVIIPPPANVAAITVGESNAIDPRLLAHWQAPIEFYGKAVDENSNTLSGVNIHFSWSERPEKGGERVSDTQSDSDGLFSLYGKRGAGLTVWFSKEGYYSSHHGQKSFNYALGPDIISPDPQNPVIFFLHKKGQRVELITSQNGIRSSLAIHVSKNNAPIRVDFFQKQVGAAGQLEISQNKPSWQEATNWSFRLSIPNGGLVENQDEFQFEAPEAGYQPAIEYNFAKDNSDWTTHVIKQFYITLGQPRQYGWLRFESDLAQETVFVTYAINPSGSQNLEPAQ